MAAKQRSVALEALQRQAERLEAECAAGGAWYCERCGADDMHLVDGLCGQCRAGLDMQASPDVEDGADAPLEPYAYASMKAPVVNGL